MTPWVKALDEKPELSSSDLCSRWKEPISSSYSQTSTHAPWLTRHTHTHTHLGTQYTHARAYTHARTHTLIDKILSKHLHSIIYYPEDPT